MEVGKTLVEFLHVGFLGQHVVGKFSDMHCEGYVGLGKFSYCRPVLRQNLVQVSEGLFYFHCAIGSVAALARRLMSLV